MKKTEKTEKELHEDLLKAVALTVNSYEDYLLDKIGWRELAQVMNSLRKSLNDVNAVDTEKNKSTK
jgi:hypothetical protein